MIIQTERGSALYITLAVMAFIGAFIVTSMEVSRQMTKQAADAQARSSQDKFIQFVEALAADPATCYGYGTLSGLTFVSLNDGSVGKDKFGLETPGPIEQDVRLASSFESSPGVARMIKGADAFDPAKSRFAAFDLVVDRFWIKNPRRINANNFQVELMQSVTAGSKVFAPRALGELLLGFTSGTLTSCELKQSGQALCEDMGCQFNATSTGQKCVCGFPEMSCPQVAGQPLSYIAGINATTNPPTPICRTFKVSCLTEKGPGFAIAGIDSNGGPICVPVEGMTMSTSPTPAATLTPTASPIPPASPTASPPVNYWIARSGILGSFVSVPPSNPVPSCTALGNPGDGDACSPVGQSCTTTITHCGFMPCVDTATGMTCATCTGSGLMPMGGFIGTATCTALDTPPGSHAAARGCCLGTYHCGVGGMIICD